MLLIECVAGQGVFWEEQAFDLCELAVASSRDEAVPGLRHRRPEPFGDMVARVTRGLFETSLEEDVASLEAQGLSDNRRLALEFRVEQKEVLELALEVLSEELVP